MVLGQRLVHDRCRFHVSGGDDRMDESGDDRCEQMYWFTSTPTGGKIIFRSDWNVLFGHDLDLWPCRADTRIRINLLRAL